MGEVDKGKDIKAATHLHPHRRAFGEEDEYGFPLESE